MSDPRLPIPRRVPLGLLVDPAAGATLRSEVVADIARSFRETGKQTHPVLLTRTGGSRFLIRNGVHRVAAAALVGWPAIDAWVLSDADARDRAIVDMLAIDADLMGKRIGPADEARLTARRKAIYEDLFPETSHGGRRDPKPEEDKSPDLATCRPRFSAAQAGVTGRSERSVQRAAQRGESLPGELLAAAARTSLDKGDELDALIKLSETRRATVVARAAAGEKVSAKAELKRAQRDCREEVFGRRIAALPDRRYGVILCDVPRHHDAWSDETGSDRAPENHYPTIPFAELLSFGVPAIAAPDSILFYWSTAASLLDDLEIMAEWGFAGFRPRGADGLIRRDPDGAPLPPAGSGRYASHWAWLKPGLGLGRWNRDRHELLLIGRRGRPPAPAPGQQPDSILEAPRGRHSEKPELFAGWIERLYPTAPKIELFRRGPARPGWDAWGNEAVGAAEPGVVPTPGTAA